MLPGDAKLYLPISEKTISMIAAGDAPMVDTLSRLSAHEIAAVIAIQQFASPQSSISERSLAATIQKFQEFERQYGRADFVASACRSIDPQKLAEGFGRLAINRIYCLDEASVATQGFLDPQGHWDYGFVERRKAEHEQLSAKLGVPRELTRQQAHAFATVRANFDDHLHVQGYAGTGKTFLIRMLVHMILGARGKVLVLAERSAQLRAILAHLGDRSEVSAMTFAELAEAIINRNHGPGLWVRSPTTGRAPDEAAWIRQFSVRNCENFTAFTMVRAARFAVRNFCQSDNDFITDEHVPQSYKTSDMQRARITEYAQAIWQAALEPRRRGVVEIFSYHQIKFASLSGAQIPGSYSHVLFDECHNLSKAMLKIIDNSPQAVISMGDEFQRLKGLVGRRAPRVRELGIQQAVRAGREVEHVLNPIIQVHPGRAKEPFVGNACWRTNVSHYRLNTIPEKPSTVVAFDEWGLFEWVQKFAHAKVGFRLLSNPDTLNVFVEDLIELYAHGTRARHEALVRYPSWDALAADKANNPGFQRIERLLKKGYQQTDWATALSEARTGTGPYLLAAVEDVLNLEFANVVVGPDIVAGVRAATPGTGAVASAVYVAATRARLNLSIPNDLMGWLEERASLARDSVWHY